MLPITHKCYYNQGPVYLKNLLVKHVPSRPLRSENLKLLDPPPHFERLKAYGVWAFIMAAPGLWNNIPLNLREIEKVESSLKTFLFKDYYE